MKMTKLVFTVACLFCALALAQPRPLLLSAAPGAIARGSCAAWQQRQPDSGDEPDAGCPRAARGDGRWHSPQRRPRRPSRRRATAGAAGSDGVASVTQIPAGKRLTPNCDEVRKKARYNIYFDKVEIEKLVQTVSDATCKTFILPENVRGKILDHRPRERQGRGRCRSVLCGISRRARCEQPRAVPARQVPQDRR